MSGRGAIPGWGSTPTGEVARDPGLPPIDQRFTTVARIYRARRREIVWRALAVQGTLGLLYLPLGILHAIGFMRLWTRLPVADPSDPAAFRALYAAILPGSDPLSTVELILAPTLGLFAGLVLTTALSALLLSPRGQDRTLLGAPDRIAPRLSAIAIPVAVVAILSTGSTVLARRLFDATFGAPAEPGSSQLGATMAGLFALEFLVLVGAIVGLWMGVRWAVAIPALVIERIGLRDALRRSAELTRGRRLTVLLTTGSVAVATGAATSFATWLPIYLLSGWLGDGPTLVLGTLAAVVLSVVLGPILPLTIVVLYRDLAAVGPRRPAAAP